MLKLLGTGSFGYFLNQKCFTLCGRLELSWLFFWVFTLFLTYCYRSSYNRRGLVYKLTKSVKKFFVWGGCNGITIFIRTREVDCLFSKFTIRPEVLCGGDIFLVLFWWKNNISNDSSAMLARNNPFFLFDICLLLGGNFIETSATSFPFDSNNSKFIVNIFSNAMIGLQKCLINVLYHFYTLLIQFLFLSLAFCYQRL